MFSSRLGRIAGFCLGVAVMAGIPTNGLSADWGHIGADLNFWAQDGDVSLRGDSPAIVGTPFQLDTDLGLDTDTGVTDGRVWVGAIGIRLVMTFHESSYDGLTSLQQDLTFNGQTFAIGENVDTSVNVSVLGTYYYQTLLPLKVVNFGFQIGVDVIDLQAVLDSQVSGLNSVSATVPLPAAGLHISIQPVPKFRFYADLSVLSASFGGEEFDLTDGRAQVEFYFNPFIGLHAGYRLFELDVISDEFGALNSTQKGPFFGMTARF